MQLLPHKRVLASKVLWSPREPHEGGSFESDVTSSKTGSLNEDEFSPIALWSLRAISVAAYTMLLLRGGV